MLVLAIAIFAVAQTGVKKPVSIIFDTDLGPDYDDVGAITLLHALGDKGECKILGTIASNQHKHIAALLDIFNTYFLRPDLPIGIVRGKAVNLPAIQKWDSIIVTKYPHDLLNNDKAEDAVKLYRKLLAGEPDTSVVIVTVGFLTNMANLMKSKPDEISSLNGMELIRKKVARLVSMAGRLDNEMGKFREFNVVQDAVSSKHVFDHWERPIIISGFEIGKQIFTGLPLIQSGIKNSPVKEVYAISIPQSQQDRNGRMSWDQTAVLVAVRGVEDYYIPVRGQFICNADGSNSWDFTKNRDIFLKEKMPVEEVTKIINELMMHQPGKK